MALPLDTKPWKVDSRVVELHSRPVGERETV